MHMICLGTSALLASIQNISEKYYKKYNEKDIKSLVPLLFVNGVLVNDLLGLIEQGFEFLQLIVLIVGHR